jgi:hypothetical protein
VHDRIYSCRDRRQSDPGFGGSIPNTVVFGGDKEDDWAESAFVDSSGGISVIGRSASRLTPTTSRFVARFGPDGRRLSMNPIPDGVPYATDQEGGLYLASSDLIKMTPDGSATLYSLPLPGTPAAITVDKANRAYVVLGVTQDGLTPLVRLARISPSGDRIEQQFQFFLGSGSAVNSMALDPNGAIYIAGTAGAGFPATPGALRQSCDPAQGSCGFVTKIASTMDRVEYATLLGDVPGSEILSVAADQDGNAYIAGTYCAGCSGGDIPATAYTGPAWPTLGSSFVAAFVAKLNPAGSALVYANGFAPGKAMALVLQPDRSVVVAAETGYDGLDCIGLWRADPQGLAVAPLTSFPGRQWSTELFAGGSYGPSTRSTSELTRPATSSWLEASRAGFLVRTSACPRMRSLSRSRRTLRPRTSS